MSGGSLGYIGSTVKYGGDWMQSGYVQKAADFLRAHGHEEAAVATESVLRALAEAQEMAEELADVWIVADRVGSSDDSPEDLTNEVRRWEESRAR